VLFAIAFSLWNIGTRPPAQLIADVRRGFSDLAILRRGLFYFLAGVIAVAVGYFVLDPTKARVHNPAVIDVIPIATALIIEQLIGPDLRARYRSH
jgi:hypothetical protein